MSGLIGFQDANLLNNDILAYLKDQDPQRRRQAIIAAGRSGDPAYIKPLQNLGYTDSDPELRELANKAIQHLRKQQPAPAAPPQSRTVPAENTAPAAKAPPRKIERDSRWSAGGAIALVIFTLTIIGVGVFAVWSTYGEMFQQGARQQQMIARLQAAPPLPLDGSTAGAALNGAVYHTVATAMTSYYVQEPVGATPPGGWSLVIALHGWTGGATDMLIPYGQTALDNGAILVAPTFDHGPGYGGYDAVFYDIGLIYDDLKRYYPIHPRATVLTGFSWGGRVAQFYTAAYPERFGGAVVGGSREYRLPPPTSAVQYAVFVGANDFFDDVDRPALARAFANDMAAQGMPVWYFEETPGVGHSMVGNQVSKTFELLAALRG